MELTPFRAWMVAQPGDYACSSYTANTERKALFQGRYKAILVEADRFPAGIDALRRGDVLLLDAKKEGSPH